MRLLPSFSIAAAAALLTACGDPDRGPTHPARSAPRGVLGVADAAVVMRGLDSPRGLAFAPDGALYVAEAGRGGVGPCFQGEVALQCYGPSGAVSRLRNGKQDRVVTGLPSYANPAGRAMGPNDISLLGMGGAYVAIGLEQHPAIRDVAPEFGQFARIVRIPASSLVPSQGEPRSGTTWEFVADLGNYEIAVNPDCGRLDTNPFALLAEPGGVIVVDAGANTLVRMAANGELSTFVALPSRYSTPQGPECPILPAGYPATLPRETVPTSVVVGPDGAYYIGQLAGFPVVVGGASIFRFEPGGVPTVAYTGFTFVIALAFDAQDNLYVLQHVDAAGAAATGSLVRVAPDGSRTRIIQGLVRATGLAIGPDGALYISHRGTSVGIGEVLRIEP